jgi:hypothetical protein
MKTLHDTHYSLRRRITVLALTLSVLLAPGSSLAYTNAQNNAVIQGHELYLANEQNGCFNLPGAQPGTGFNASTSAGTTPTQTNTSVTTIQGMHPTEVARLVALIPIYQQAAQQTGIPWQVFASIDYREDNNQANKSMLGGENLGIPATDSGLTPHTKLESIIMGANILKGLAKNVYGVDVTKPMNADQLKEAFVTYNRGNAYKRANTSPDFSPYVMNNFDNAEHKNMVWPNIPGETLAGAKEVSRLGAFTVFSRLPGGGAIGAGTQAPTCDVTVAGQTVLPGEVCKVSPDGGTLNEIDCAAYWAQKVLDLVAAKKIILMNSQYTRGDLDSAVAKRPIHNSDTCGHDTYLHPQLLYAMVQVASGRPDIKTVPGNPVVPMTIGIYNIVSGHGCDQFLHPKGRASDIGAVDGLTTDVTRRTGGGINHNRQFAEAIAMFLPDQGSVLQANKCFTATLPKKPAQSWTIRDNYDTCNHVHIDVGSQVK